MSNSNPLNIYIEIENMDSSIVVVNGIHIYVFLSLS